MGFYAERGSNQSVSPAAASARITIEARRTAVRLYNSGGNVCYVRIGTGDEVATTADTPIPAATVVILRKGDGENVLAHIAPAGTTLQVQTGEEY